MQTDKEKAYDAIFQEVDGRIQNWDTNMTSFFGEWDEYSSSYRMLPRTDKQGKPKSIFNSRTGETARAGDTLADVWLRMLMPSDLYLEARRQGLNNYGQEISEGELYGVEGLLMRQFRDFELKKETRRCLTSLSIMGLMFAEEPWLRNKRTRIQGTGLKLRSLIQTAFNPFVSEANDSEFVASIDYMDKSNILWQAKSDPTTWDLPAVEAALAGFDVMSKSTARTNVWNRIVARKQRAGYTLASMNMPEIITYHGRLEPSPFLEEIWAASGNTGDMRDSDWTVRVIAGKVVSVYPTPYGSWQNVFKTATVNLWELEPIGYGVGRRGNNYQKELDFTQSNLNNLLTFQLMNMWKVGRFAGLRQAQIPLSPLGMVKLDKISDMEALRPPLEALPHGMNLMNVWREDFRNTTGAKSNLQAVADDRLATIGSLNQVEAIRSAGVATEIINETFFRPHIEQSHLNNLHLLDEGIWAHVAGIDKPQYFHKDNLPYNVGFEVKTGTDRSIRPINQLIQMLQVVTSMKNYIGEDVNAVRPILEEMYKSANMDPRRLTQPLPMKEQLMNRLRRQQMQGQMETGMAGDVSSGGADGNSNVQESGNTGPVPTSPVAVGA